SSMVFVYISACFFLSSSAPLLDLHSFPTRRSSDLQQILYCACHDDYTLFDHISAVTKDGFDVERAQRMAAFMLFSGLGIPFIQADRKSTRLNSSHVSISYAVFCLKKKNKH